MSFRPSSPEKPPKLKPSRSKKTVSVIGDPTARRHAAGRAEQDPARLGHSTVSITDSGNGIQIVSRKQKASPGAVSRATSTDLIRARTGSCRALGIAVLVTCKKAGRPDLRTAALARVSALLAAQKEPKETPAKKSRSKKTKAAPAAVARKSKAAVADDDDDLPDLV
ncbi:hypothetical protein B0H13DRAFT_2373994 [Mycena leptocephala]|nr:hypothetical protein B0H13DRAFT_2373994 [Mycena leptocephala]